MSHEGENNLASENIKREYEENWRCIENQDPLAQWDPIGISFKILKKEEKDMKKEYLSQNETNNTDLQHATSDDECDNDSNTSLTGLFVCNETSGQNIEKEITRHENLLKFKHKNEKKRHIKYFKSIEKLDCRENDEKYEKKFACADCGERFFGFRLLQKHINDVHLGTNNYTETFPLERHVTSLDTNRKKYECQVCHKKFSRQYDLIQHGVVHTKEKVLKDYEEALAVVQHEDQQQIHKSIVGETEEKLNFHQKGKIYACTICDRRYTERRTLNSHIEAIHLGLSHYKCAKCNKVYSKLSALKRHTGTVHNDNKYNSECPICNKKFAHPTYLKSHSITHTTKKYECADCGWKCFWYTYLKKHIVVNCKANLDNKYIRNKKISCSTCGMNFTKFCDLQTHRTLEHLGINYKCALCNKTFSTINTLKRHINSVHSLKKYECQVCQKKFTTLTCLTMHSVYHTTKKYKCGDCDWKFFTFGLLKRHITLSCKANLNNRGINVKKYSCDTCEKKYMKYQNLCAHVRLVHLGITDYKCTECNKTYPFIWSLRKHNNRVHDDKNYQCTLCHKKFFNLYLLNQHIEVHNGTKKYVCEDCGKKYFKFSCLKQHINGVHNKIKDYQCEQCGKRFSESHRLEHHVNLVHKKIREFECQICYKRFQAKHHLENHIICVHEKVKNFVCEQCGDRFLLAHHLRNHVKYVHMGITR